MNLVKKEFVDNQSVIMAEDMNNIQDAIIENENEIKKINPRVATLGGVKMYEVTPGETSIATGATKTLTFKDGIKGLLYIFGASNNTMGCWMINSSPAGVVYLATVSAPGATSITVTVNASSNKKLDIRNGTSTINLKAYLLILDGDIGSIS